MKTWFCGIQLETWLLWFYGAASLAGVWPVVEYLHRTYWTAWYDISNSGYLGKLVLDLDKEDSPQKARWKLLRGLIDADPLKHDPRLRKWPWRQLVRDLMALPLVIFLWASVGYGILHGIHAIEPSETAVENQMRLPVFLFGFCTFGATLVGAFYQLRLKARTDKRQKWIDEMREVLASLIANLPFPEQSQDVVAKTKERYSSSHAKLELLLNPSEEVHRTLMALIRHAYGFDDVPLIDDWIRKAPGFDDVFQTFPVSGADKEKDDHLRKTKSQIIRLSNVVLKREWEQVKHAK